MSIHDFSLLTGSWSYLKWRPNRHEVRNRSPARLAEGTCRLGSPGGLNALCPTRTEIEQPRFAPRQSAAARRSYFANSSFRIIASWPTPDIAE